MNNNRTNRISIVIPVYAGERTLPTLIAELLPLTQVQTTPGGNSYIVCEVLLVHDCGPDRSDKTLEALSRSEERRVGKECA